jgi:hypothetical protein
MRGQYRRRAMIKFVLVEKAALYGAHIINVYRVEVTK